MIRKRILTRDNVVNLVKLVNEEMDSETKAYEDELHLISRSIADVNNRLEKLYDAIETDKINLDELVPRIRELQGRQEQLQSRRVEIESQISDRKVEMADLETIYSDVDDLHNLLKEGTLIEKRSFIRSFVKLVKVKDGETELKYFMPALPDKAATDKEEVLPTVPYGGRYWT